MEAGIDVDVSSLRLIGTRGVLIAVVGSLLPIALGILLATVIQTGDGTVRNPVECLAAGATFGPTSVGVALSLLRSGGLLNTPVGQLIIAAAVIDDMIALIVLSQLESLNNDDATTNAWTVLSPIVSATLFLVVGGWLALFCVPPLIQTWLHPAVPPEHLGKAELACLFALVLALMPATHVVKASYLMGTFLAGLAFCTSSTLHSEFVRQFKRILQWLLRIFFAASIGFQVPIKDFIQAQVLWKGLIFCFALVGKLAVGFLVPNFTQSPAFTDKHLRDCLLTGFSMASEGEFAFVIAVFSVGQGLIGKELYASVVLAVLLSTIIPPFCLRATIAYYNTKAQEQLKDLANQELERNTLILDGSTTGGGGTTANTTNTSSGGGDGSQGGAGGVVTVGSTGSDGLTSSQRREQDLVGSIVDQTAVFLCIQSHSEGRWGLMHALMSTLAKLGLEVIDHRAWHPRGIDTTLVSEIYAKDVLQRLVNNSTGDAEDGFTSTQQALEHRLDEIKQALERTINQPDVARVKVQRWYPGVVEQIVEESNHGPLRRHISLEASLLQEATARLTRKQSVQTNATREKSVEEILEGLPDLPTSGGGGGGGDGGDGGGVSSSNDYDEEPDSLWRMDDPTNTTHHSHGRRGRRKVRSSPVVGGGLFGETVLPTMGLPPRRGITNHSFGALVGGGDEPAVHMPSSLERASSTSSLSAPRKWQYRRGGPAELLPNHATPVSLASGRAEISIDNETYDVRVSTGTLKKLRGAYHQRYQGNRRSGNSRYGNFQGLGSNTEDVVDLHIQPTTDDVTDMLHGYIRHGGHAPPLTQITETKDEFRIIEEEEDPSSERQQQQQQRSRHQRSSSDTTPMLEPNQTSPGMLQKSLELLQSSSSSSQPYAPLTQQPRQFKKGDDEEEMEFHDVHTGEENMF